MKRSLNFFQKFFKLPSGFVWGSVGVVVVVGVVGSVVVVEVVGGVGVVGVVGVLLETFRIKTSRCPLPPQLLVNMTNCPLGSDDALGVS